AVATGGPALDGLPRGGLGGAVLPLPAGGPAARRRIEEDPRPAERGEPRRFGKPLIPADQRTDASRLGVEAAEADVARREVVLLVVERIVGDVHLAVAAGDGSVGVDEHRGVVKHAFGALLEQTGDHHDPARLGDATQRFGAWPGDRLRQIERRGVLALAEVLRAKQLLQADDARAAPRRLLYVCHGLG